MIEQACKVLTWGMRGHLLGTVACVEASSCGQEERREINPGWHEGKSLEQPVLPSRLSKYSQKFADDKEPGLYGYGVRALESFRPACESWL